MLTQLLAASLLAPAVVPPKIVAVSMFKNGYAVVVREADLPASGVLEIPNPPVGTLGTLWLNATDGIKIEDTVFTSKQSKSSVPLATFDALLANNIGKEMAFVFSGIKPGEPIGIQGKLLAASSELLTIEADGQVRFFPRSWLLMITEVEGKTIARLGDSVVNVPTLRVTAKGSGKIYLMSLERGITWVPAYAVDISDPKEMRLIAKATILNDLAPLENLEARLVTGFPNIRFLGVLDPLTNSYGMQQFLGSIVTAAGAPPASASPLTQNAARRMEASEGVFDISTAAYDMSSLEGFDAGDLFFYRLPGVKLQPGERGAYMLFETRSEYKHVYTLGIPDGVGRLEERMPGNDELPLDVWHEIEFRNETKQPLTTAAAITTSSGQIVGQDMLNYTPPGALARLKITKALDIRADRSEEEISREQGKLKLRDGTVYDEVVVKGTIRLKNRKKEKVDLRISKQTTGLIESASHQGKIFREAKGLRAVNPFSSVTWSPSLDAGQELELEYQFRIFVRV